MSIVNKITTFVIMTIAKAYCGTWYFARCRLFRRIDDFDYHISQLDNTDGLPFFNKVVEVNNLYEKTQSVKIGKVNVRYTFEKSAKASDVKLFVENPTATITCALTEFPDKKLHHNSSVVKMKNYRKENDVVTRQTSR